ncbi:hypothetical protein BZG36_01602 [Bifiguratus adelaidae]|uniref:Arsenite methyltransferase n=1 Tax=Bifiguratus adelaidae TaxID=1938954 RepID=A0A261Y4F1_9FUNG|nr:hypothetical protein BZG36_01602 [Bifiguratus adelaidae]
MPIQTIPAEASSKDEVRPCGCKSSCCAHSGDSENTEAVSVANSSKNRENPCCSRTCCSAEKTELGENVDTQQVIREKYGQAATKVVQGSKTGCCGSKAVLLEGVDHITRDLYSSSESAEVPTDALLASLGCGNPTALASLTPGEIVLDLGSGGGIDVILSARRVAPGGKAYGLDMTPEMLSLARANQRKAGIENAEFFEGNIEKIPLPDDSVDVVISNCVINLSTDKDTVFREAFRVLKPAGRFAVSDIVLTRNLPEEARKSLELWAGCIAGALLVDEYRAKLTSAGFIDIGIEPTRVYSSEDVKEIAGMDSALASNTSFSTDVIGGAAMSAFIRARKPALDRAGNP